MDEIDRNSANDNSGKCCSQCGTADGNKNPEKNTVGDAADADGTVNTGETADTDNGRDTQSANGNQLQKLTAEINELRKLLLQKMADTDNLRKRLEREKNDAVKYANGKFAKDLLGVADNFCRVMDTMNLLEQKTKQDATLAAIVDGIALCEKELTSTLERHGVYKISVAVGDAFDPSLHQAMCEVDDSTHNPGSVVQVLQSGYVHNDRLLRPAMVTVSKKP
jgi:molecular chaperone GrpE